MSHRDFPEQSLRGAHGLRMAAIACCLFMAGCGQSVQSPTSPPPTPTAGALGALVITTGPPGLTRDEDQAGKGTGLLPSPGGGGLARYTAEGYMAGYERQWSDSSLSSDASSQHRLTVILLQFHTSVGAAAEAEFLVSGDRTIPGFHPFDVPGVPNALAYEDGGATTGIIQVLLSRGPFTIDFVYATPVTGATIADARRLVLQQYSLLPAM